MSNRTRLLAQPRGTRSERFSFSAAAPWEMITVSAGGVAENQSNTSTFVKYLTKQSQFDTMEREELLENLYIEDPEISSAADSFSVMCKESYKGFIAIDDSEYEHISNGIDLESIGDEEEDDEINDTDDHAYVETFSESTDKSLINEMVDLANKISKNTHIDDLFETYGALVFIHGNTYLRLNPNISLTVLPNDRVTIIDTKERLTVQNATGIEFKDVITEANWLILDEGKNTQKEYSPESFRIIKFREVPVNIQDKRGRMTYGIYSVSPLRRAIAPVWYKRLIMANDALWRAKNVPREHHKINAEAFHTGLYQGSNEQRMRKATQAAQAFINSYKEEISQQAPDQAYITLDTIAIDHVEPKSAAYMQANELLNQMNDSIYSAVNLPRSVVKGVSGSNYASELVISGYTSTKVIQISKKIGAVILEVMKLKLKKINPKYPIEYLDISINYDLGTSPLEKFKQAQVMASLGIFTANEIRAVVDYKPLTKDQLKEGVINTSNSSSGTSTADGEQESGKTNYPTTPHSADKQPTDSAKAVINKVDQKLSPSKLKSS